MSRLLKIHSHYYQQFDADPALDVPAEGYGGWKSTDLTFDFSHTALCVMHAWDTGTREQFPGWHRCVEYIPRAQHIADHIFPPILEAARSSGMTVYHVVGGGDEYKTMPGFKRAMSLAKYPEPKRPAWLHVDDPVLAGVRQFRSANVFVGTHNQADVNAGFKDLKFLRPALPRGDEGVAEDGTQLFGLCQADNINHLIYIGFAINWCLLLSPGGMHDMAGRGLMCSTIRQATTAVESKESARNELAKQIALWRVALAFGFVFDDHEFIRAVRATPR